MTISILRAIILWLALLTATHASAAEPDFIEAGDKVSAGSGTTYLDLALQFAPGLASTPADGSALVKLPHLGGADMSAAITNPAIQFIERIDVTQDGKPALLLLFDLGDADDAAQSVTVLALYDMSSNPRLLDAMDVGLDRETSLQEPRYAALSPDRGMVFLRSSHHNAGEEYLQTSLVGLWRGKFHAVDTIFSMSWNGGTSRTVTAFSFAAAKDAAGVDATVDISRIHCDAGCEPDSQGTARNERLDVRYRWDTVRGTFVRPKDAYDRIPLPDMQE